VDIFLWQNFVLPRFLLLVVLFIQSEYLLVTLSYTTGEVKILIPFLFPSHKFTNYTCWSLGYYSTFFTIQFQLTYNGILIFISKNHYTSQSIDINIISWVMKHTRASSLFKRTVNRYNGIILLYTFFNWKQCNLLYDCFKKNKIWMVR